MPVTCGTSPWNKPTVTARTGDRPLVLLPASAGWRRLAKRPGWERVPRRSGNRPYGTSTGHWPTGGAEPTTPYLAQGRGEPGLLRPRRGGGQDQPAVGRARRSQVGQGQVPAVAAPALLLRHGPDHPGPGRAVACELLGGPSRHGSPAHRLGDRHRPGGGHHDCHLGWGDVPSANQPEPGVEGGPTPAAARQAEAGGGQAGE